MYNSYITMFVYVALKLERDIKSSFIVLFSTCVCLFVCLFTRVVLTLGEYRISFITQYHTLKNKKRNPFFFLNLLIKRCFIAMNSTISEFAIIKCHCLLKLPYFFSKNPTMLCRCAMLPLNCTSRCGSRPLLLLIKFCYVFVGTNVGFFMIS